MKLPMSETEAAKFDFSAACEDLIADKTLRPTMAKALKQYFHHLTNEEEAFSAHIADGQIGIEFSLCGFDKDPESRTSCCGPTLSFSLVDLVRDHIEFSLNWLNYDRRDAHALRIQLEECIRMIDWADEYARNKKQNITP